MEKRDLGRLRCACFRDEADVNDRHWDQERLDAAQRKRGIRPRDYTYETEFVEMQSDGTRLAVDVLLPTHGEGKFPVIFHQTRYGRSVRLRRPWRYCVQGGRPIDLVNMPLKRAFLNAGFAVVSVDVRGTGASFGRWITAWSMQERQDSVEMLDWIDRQPWSSGRVALYGMSYDGGAALRTLSTRHPTIAACAVVYPFWDIYSCVTFPGGVPLRSFLEQWNHVNRSLDNNDFGKMSCLLGCFVRGMSKPSTRTDDRAISKLSSGEARSLLKKAVLGHKDNYDVVGDLLKLRAVDEVSESIGSTVLHQSTTYFAPDIFDSDQAKPLAPVLALSGWLDCTTADAICAYTAAVASGAENCRLVVGPWSHGGTQQVRLKKGSATSFTSFDMVGEVVDFYRCALGSQPTGSPVHYFNMESGQWMSAETWPPAGQTKQSLFLGQRDLLSGSPETQSGSRTLAVDLKVYPKGNSRWEAMIKQTSFISYSGISEKDGFLCSFSNPIPQDMEVTGCVIAELFLESTDSQADVFVYVLDGDTSGGGRHSYVTEGRFRCIHRKEKSDDDDDIQRWSANIPQAKAIPIPRHSFREADIMEKLPPKEPVRVAFALAPTSYLFRKGSRIGIAISGADVKHFRVDSHMAQPGAKRTLTFHTGGSCPSAFHFPVVRQT